MAVPPQDQLSGMTALNFHNRRDKNTDLEGSTEQNVTKSRSGQRQARQWRKIFRENGLQARVPPFHPLSAGSTAVPRAHACRAAWAVVCEGPRAIAVAAVPHYPRKAAPPRHMPLLPLSAAPLLLLPPYHKHDTHKHSSLFLRSHACLCVLSFLPCFRAR